MIKKSKYWGTPMLFGNPPYEDLTIIGFFHRELTMIPIGSMYAIYGSIYHQYTPNVSIYIYIYIPYMDPMGLIMGEQ